MSKVTPKKVPSKRGKESTTIRSIDNLPEVALAAVTSSKRQKDVGVFIDYLLCALERNTAWLNSVVGKHNDFQCALMVGAGPHRFNVQELIYPTPSDKQIKLEIELKDNDDHDKVAIAAILKMSNSALMHLMDFVKYRLYENPMLKDDLLKGKGMGISFAVLKPVSDKQYRVMERIVLGHNLKQINGPPKKIDNKPRPAIKKVKADKTVKNAA